MLIDTPSTDCVFFYILYACSKHIFYILLYSCLQESLPTFINANNAASRTRILGKIFYIETHVATAQANAYNVAEGTEYHLCFVEKVHWKGVSPAGAV
jgi:hypothetical protein